MCGIFGVINLDGRPVDTEKVQKTKDLLMHRGPDDEGVFYSSFNPDFVLTSESRHSANQHSVALAHRRLSIIDLSPSGHQPMSSEDGRYTIVYNGEIYNYKNLITNPYSKEKGVFKSNSDTEVILYLYAMYGKDCLKLLRGMFAFAIWDDKEKKLFAARDRFGIKPFYYLYNDKEFIFASELNAIKFYKNGLTVSTEGIDAFLKTGSVPAPLTIYEETKALLPGCWMEIKIKSNSKNKIEINKYWSFFDLFEGYEDNGFQTTCLPDRQGRNDSQKRYDDEAKRIIRESLLDSIHAHMVADVEVGAFLSGGIDSTAIVSLMRQAGQEKIKTISVTFPGFVYDEAEFSNVAAQAFGTNHYEYRLQEQEIIDELEKIITVMDQPTIDGINTYFVAKAAKSFGLKVVLSGLGGDELFGGYPSFYKIPRYHRIANLPFAPLAMKAAIPFFKNKLPAKAVQFMKEPKRDNAEYILMRGLFTDDELKELGWKHSYIHPFMQFDKGNQNSGIQYRESIKEYAADSKKYLNPLQHVSYLESTFYMRNQLLRDSDVFSMAHSLELRVPFVDHLLYKTVLPYLHYGFDKDETKRMLVNAAGDIPKVISERLKMGFTFPFDVWMRNGKLKEIVKDSLLSDKSLHPFPVETRKYLLNKFENKKIHWSRIWTLFILSKIV